MPAVCTSLAMVSVSDLMKELNAVLLIGIAAAPMLSKRVLNSGEFKIFTTSALSLSRTGLGVLLGASLPNVMVVSPSKGYKDVKDLIAKVKAKPDGFNYASAATCCKWHHKFNALFGPVLRLRSHADSA